MLATQSARVRGSSEVREALLARSPAPIPDHSIKVGPSAPPRVHKIEGGYGQLVSREDGTTNIIVGETPDGAVVLKRYESRGTDSPSDHDCVELRIGPNRQISGTYVEHRGEDPEQDTPAVDVKEIGSEAVKAFLTGQHADFFSQLPQNLQRQLGFLRSRESSLEARLVDQFGDDPAIPRLVHAIRDKVGVLQQFGWLSEDSMSRIMFGGGIARIQAELGGNPYIVRIEDKTTALKTSLVPYLVHQEAEKQEPHPLAKFAANKLPKVALLPVEDESGLYVSLHEDVSRKLARPDPLEERFVSQYQKKGLDANTIRRIYSYALIETVLTDVVNAKNLSPEQYKALVTPNSPDYLSIGDLEDRFGKAGVYPEAKGVLENLSKRRNQRLERLAEYGKNQPPIFTHKDPKPEHLVNGYVLDWGISSHGTDLHTTARNLVLDESIATNPKALQAYAQAASEMREQLVSLVQAAGSKQVYQIPGNIGQLVHDQVTEDSVRLAGWQALRHAAGTPLEKTLFRDYWRVAQSLLN